MSGSGQGPRASSREQKRCSAQQLTQWLVCAVMLLFVWDVLTASKQQQKSLQQQKPKRNTHGSDASEGLVASTTSSTTTSNGPPPTTVPIDVDAEQQQEVVHVRSVRRAAASTAKPTGAGSTSSDDAHEEAPLTKQRLRKVAVGDDSGAREDKEGDGAAEAVADGEVTTPRSTEAVAPEAPERKGPPLFGASRYNPATVVRATPGLHVRRSHLHSSSPTTTGGGGSRPKAPAPGAVGGGSSKLQHLVFIPRVAALTNEALLLQRVAAEHGERSSRWAEMVEAHKRSIKEGKNGGGAAADGDDRLRKKLRKRSGGVGASPTDDDDGYSVQQRIADDELIEREKERHEDHAVRPAHWAPVANKKQKNKNAMPPNQPPKSQGFQAAQDADSHAAMHPHLRTHGEGGNVQRGGLNGESSTVDADDDDEVLLLPLIVYLHGAGEIGTDVMKLLTSAPAEGTIPQLLGSKDAVVNWSSPHPLLREQGASSSSSSLPPFISSSSPEGYDNGGDVAVGSFPAIVLMPQSPVSWRQRDAIEGARQLVLETMDTVFEVPSPKEENKVWEVVTQRVVNRGKAYKWVGIDHRRIFVTGASNGGHGAYSLHLSMPHTFAAVIPVAGFLVPSDDEALLADATAHFCRTLMQHHRDESRKTLNVGEGEGGGGGGGDVVEDPRAAARHPGAFSRPRMGHSHLIDRCETSLYLVHGPNDQIVPVTASDAVAETCTNVVGVPKDCFYFEREDTPDAQDGTVNGHAAWVPAYAATSKLWSWLSNARL